MVKARLFIRLKRFEERLLALLSVAIALIGIVSGWFIFMKRPLLQLPRILENKYYVDEIYDAAIINPIKVGSREGLWKLFDVGVIDGFLHSLGDDLRFVTITSAVQVIDGAVLSVVVSPSTAPKCERCWHYRADVGSDAAHPTICGRCVSNLHGAGEKRVVA